ncbi:hypothetical protein [Blastococcus sp. VKM Ac-2987]|uniref:hypothetical protein n=1 Tax=Blastococcus sp. VKM Ac-2987 TaxID=3004141 RepID=UPI0022AB79CA|nr:hypothetical protein [Blastococcus sp. VKM Ac-2987]MCZ2857822.1 hypothetical protein [Blastococcus sp. VKM Ac-2987]
MSWGQFWSDHGASAVTTAIGALLGFLISWSFFRASRKRKYLAWHLAFDEWLVAPNAPEGLVVSYDGKNLTRPRMVSINILNAGNRGIDREHYTDDVVVHIADSLIRSVTYNPLRMAPKTQFSFQEESDRLTIRPVRMNQGDAYNLRLLVDGGTRGDVNVSATLFEESSAPRREADWSPPSSTLSYAMNYVLLTLLFALFFSSLIIAVAGGLPLPAVIFVFVLCIILSYDVFQTLRRERHSRRSVRLAKQPGEADDASLGRRLLARRR